MLKEHCIEQLYTTVLLPGVHRHTTKNSLVFTLPSISRQSPILPHLPEAGPMHRSALCSVRVLHTKVERLLILKKLHFCRLLRLHARTLSERRDPANDD